MPDFSRRSYQPEMLDAPGIERELLYQNLRELNFINTWLGGHQITRKGFSHFNRWFIVKSVCEIGCGGGDNLIALSGLGEKNMQLTGIDLKSDCTAFAQQQPALKEACFQTCDYRDAVFSENPDVIFSSLFCHHFTDEQLVAQLRWMYKHSNLGFFINDLHRHPLAWQSIRFLTRWFSKSVLVKNDAPLSVLRGFTRQEWVTLFKQTDIPHFKIRWCWAFRWLIIVEK